MLVALGRSSGSRSRPARARPMAWAPAGVARRRSLARSSSTPPESSASPRKAAARTTVKSARWARRLIEASSRVLPMPASPDSSSRCPRPAAVWLSRRSARASGSSRPTSTGEAMTSRPGTGLPPRGHVTPPGRLGELAVRPALWTAPTIRQTSDDRSMNFSPTSEVGPAWASVGRPMSPPWRANQAGLQAFSRWTLHPSSGRSRRSAPKPPRRRTSRRSRGKPDPEEGRR